MTNTKTLSTIALNSTLSGKSPEHVIERAGQLWYEINGSDEMPPFLMTMASDSDHWLFLSSNGGLTAGRVNPDKALFPYYTQDKLEEMAESSGSRTLIRNVRKAGQPVGNWQPFTKLSEWDADVTRTIRKNIYGNHIEMEESHSGLGIRETISWRPSGRFGLVRKVCLENTSDQGLEFQILDGLQNILPPGINQRFINEFSMCALLDKHAVLKHNNLVSTHNT